MSSIPRLLGCAAALTVVAVAVVFALQEDTTSASQAAHPESSGKIDPRILPYVHGKISPARETQRPHPEAKRAAAAPAPVKAAVPVTYGEMRQQAPQSREAAGGKGVGEPSRPADAGSSPAEQKESARTDEARSAAPVL
ncbi:MAG: hypothetical protein J6P53_07230, partial [Mailhella sp.]|nr:hypothetical protein [Mailhella sp.]